MRLPSNVRRAAVVALPALLVVALSGCAQTGTDSSSSDSAVTSPGASACTKGSLPLHTPGRLTIATDSPAYSPWYVNNDPSNGKGFESAVAYAVAKKLGFSPSQVTWVKESFNNSYTPGPKSFDFDINQISITPERAKAVDFSTGYYDAAQAVVTLTKNAAEAKTLTGLKKLKLGAETATTSLTAIRNDVRPTQQPLVFDTDNEAKQALLNGQVDAIVTDLPSAFYITEAEIPHSTITGQFQSSGTPEEFGMLLQKGSGLTHCLDNAVNELKSDGELAAIQTKWLSHVVNVPVLK